LWEGSNEPNVQRWKGVNKVYNELLSSGSFEEIKRVHRIAVLKRK